MLNAGLVRALRAGLVRLRDPLFWLLLVGALGLAGMLGLLIVYAAERHDAFLRLRPILCEEGIADHRFIMVAMAAPLWLAFTLSALGELWGQVELRRHGRTTRWMHFWLFLALASALGALVLFGLGC